MSPRAASDRRQQLIGILLLLGAVSCFACLDASAKWLNRTYNPLQTAAVRYIGSVLLVTAFLNPRTTPGVMRTHRPRLQVARACCLLVATICGFTALRYLPLTQLTSITFAAPLIVALIAGPLIGEKIGPRRLVAVFVGFIGVLIITRPGSSNVHPAALLGILMAFANALYSIATRRLAANDTPETTMFYTGLVGAGVMIPISPFVWETPPDALTWLVMFILCLFAGLGHWLLILAHKRAPATVLAPFFYVQLVAASIVGAIVFGERPDRWTVVGAAIVIGSGLYILYRERVRKKQVPSLDIPA